MCRTEIYGFSEVLRHAGRDSRGPWNQASERLAGLGDGFEVNARVSIQGGDAHDPQDLKISHALAKLGEGQQVGRLNPAAARVIREIQLDKPARQRVLQTQLFFEGRDQRGAVNRVDDSAVAQHRPNLVALQLTDEVPVHVAQIGGLFGLGLGLLIAILAKVALPQRMQLTNQFGSMVFADHD